MNTGERVDILKYTTYLLLQCGFQASQIGYRYLREAVLIACFDEEVVTSVTKLLDDGNTPEQILEILLGDMGLEITDTMPTQYYCNCDKERVEKAVVSIGRNEINEMIQEGKPIEVKCHFCNTAYEFTVEDLKRMVKRS